MAIKINRIPDENPPVKVKMPKVAPRGQTPEQIAKENLQEVEQTLLDGLEERRQLVREQSRDA